MIPAALDGERATDRPWAACPSVAALAQLSPAVRSAVQLRVVDELDYPIVAQRLGISEQAARARVSRGPAALAALLDTSTVNEAVRT